MSYEKLNKEIIRLVGGKKNIKAAAHCMTRLRLTLKDRNLAQSEDIKNIDGVIDVVSNDIAYQIVIGTHVTDVYNEFMEMAGLSKENEEEKNTKPKGIKGVFSSILAVISETMTSIIEVLLAAGILAGLLAVLTLTGILSEKSQTYLILDTLRGAIFHFLPVFIGASAARRLNVNQYVAMALAVTLLSANIDGAEGLSFFGVSLPATGYANTFIPILLGVWCLSVVTKYLKKFIPNSLQYFLVPMLALIITLPITLMLFGPIGTWIGDGLNAIFDFLMRTVGNWSVIALYAAFQPFLVVLGAANFVYPIVLNFMASLGYDPIFGAAASISDIAVCGAMLGYFLRTKDSKEKQTFGTVSFSALMGVTEPAVFGVFVKYRKPFIAVIAGGGIGGLIAGLTGVKNMSMAWGLTAIPTYLAGGTSNFIFMVISMIAAFVIATAVAYGIGIPAEKSNSEVIKSSAASETDTVGQLKVGNIADGEVIPLAEVNDKAFATGALGKGVGIIPTNAITKVMSPVDGVVTVVFPTKHAYGIKTTNGLELLIHIGIDTVNLEGKFFESSVEQGQTVQQGDLIASYQATAVKEAGFDPIIIAVVTNTSDYLDVIPTKEQNMDELITIIL